MPKGSVIVHCPFGQNFARNYFAFKFMFFLWLNLNFMLKKSGVQHCTCARLYLAILFLYIPDSGFVLVMSEACKLGNV